jgi:hypothetical protein
MIINPHPNYGPELLPTIVCSWCKRVLRIGTPKISHGICPSCAALFFGPRLPAPARVPVPVPVPVPAVLPAA